MLRIVMDSAGDLPAKWIEEYEIEVIPVNVHLGNQVFLEGVDLCPDGFYDWVEETGGVPKTSQPAPQQYINLYREIAKPGDVILSIHLTSKLSGTYESAVLAARELHDADFKVIPFDTFSGTGIQGYMCREAREMDRRGASIEEILERLEQIKEQNQVIFTVDTLDFAQKSGRVQMIEAILATVLKIKPIITIKEGTMVVANKVRTRKASLEYILQEMSRRLGKDLINAAVMHANDLATALEISEKVKGILNIKNLFVEEVSIGIAAHLGPGTVGIVAYPVEEGTS